MTRKKYDRLMKPLIYIGTSFTAITLLAIVLFTFTSGTALISWKLITGDYYAESFSVEITDIDSYCNCDYEYELLEGEFYSNKWGILLSDVKDNEGKNAIEVKYVAEASPLRSGIDSSSQTTREIEEGTFVSNYIITDSGNAYVKNGAESVMNLLEKANNIGTFNIIKEGGGIRGSIISTLYLIIITLIIAVPFGVLTAIYINEYGKKGKLLNSLSTMIDMLTGVPSIIYGLLGAGIFIPLVNNVSGTGGNFGSIMAGGLTMSVILLPVIVKTTSEALNQVPQDLRNASLALGANNTQTTFKVVLLNCIPGIISGIILGIGRIVGESAALIFAMGTLISDNPGLFDRSTSLAVHIWTVMSGEVPNFELASAIALIVLMVVLILNLVVKQVSNKFNKMNRI